MPSHHDALRDIDRQILWVAVLDIPGTLLVAAGLFGKISPTASDVVPFLGDKSLVNSMLFAGVMLMGWCGWRFFTLMRRRGASMRQEPGRRAR